MILSLLARLIWCGSCHRPTVLLAGQPVCVFCEVLDRRTTQCPN